MITLLNVFLGYVVGGVVGNTAHDLAKRFWQAAFGKDLEDLLIGSFTKAVKKQKQQLAKYGDPVTLDRASVRVALHRDLHADLDLSTLAVLSSEEFSKRLAPILSERQLLIIGGHNLATADYEQLISTVARIARGVLRKAVAENPAVYNAVMLDEARKRNLQFDELRAALKSHTDLTEAQIGTVLEKISDLFDAMKSTDIQLGSIHTLVRIHADFTATQHEAILEHTRSLPAMAQGIEYLTTLMQEHDERTNTELSRPFQLPADNPKFVGRVAEIERLTQLLLRQGESVVRICALVGMGGIGKSTLAVHIGHLLEQRFPDGILWANLREDKLLNVQASFALALGSDLREVRSLEARSIMLRSILAGKHLLVILDNAQSDNDIRPLLPSSPTVAVIVTSRQRLPSLREYDTFDLELLGEADSFLLLEFYIGKERIQKERAAAKRICNVAGSLPLAISIAGGRLASKRHWTLSYFTDRLQQSRKRLNEFEMGERPEHNVRVTFSLSYEELEDPLKRLFCLLSLFVAPDFGVRSAARLTGTTPEEARDLIETLVHLALLQPAPNERYKFHDLVRLFARERLVQELQSGAVDEARIQLLKHFVEFACLHQHDHSLLDQEREDMLGTIAWASGSSSGGYQVGNHPADQVGDLIIKLVSCLRDYLLDRGYWPQARDALTSAVHVAAELGYKDQETELRHILGIVCLNQGDYEHAARHLEDCLAVARNQGDTHVAIDCLSRMAYMSRERGDYRMARDYIQQAMALQKETGDKIGHGRSHCEMGRTFDFEGNYKEARHHYAEAVVIQEKTDDRSGLALTLYCTACTYAYQGNYLAALTHFERSLDIAEETADSKTLERTLGALGCLYSGYFHAFSFPEIGTSRPMDDPGIAREYLRRALDINTELGDRRGVAHTQTQIAFTYVMEGDYGQAQRWYQEARAHTDLLEGQLGMARMLHEMGWMWLRMGDYDKAIEHLEQSQTLAEALPDKTGLVRTLYELGFICWEQEEFAAAFDNLNRSKAIAVEIDDQRALGYINSMLGLVARAQGETDDADRLWTEARRTFDSLQATESEVVSDWLGG
jgi:tetratricopeptide (TPR) repeat protein